jgi:flavin reductase (DIM6/NTAB) family NADH-FMN oxidoreductase RutF
MSTHTVDALDLRKAFSQLPTGVAAVCAEVGGKPMAMVVSTFMVGISLDTPLVTFAAQKSSQTWRVLRDAENLGVSVLAEGQAGEAMQMASKDSDRRLSEIAIEQGTGSALLLTDSVLRMNCVVTAEVEAGDHKIVVLGVQSTEVSPGLEPLVFHGSAFRALRSRPARLPGGGATYRFFSGDSDHREQFLAESDDGLCVFP